MHVLLLDVPVAVEWLGAVSKDVLRRLTSTGSGRFAFLGRGLPLNFWGKSSPYKKRHLEALKGHI